MLFRREGDAVLALSQTTHAWISGQLAREWGGGGFASLSPREEMCLGAEQHDIGWLDWEAAPALNAATGLPFDFRELPARAHTDIWRRGTALALAFGLYPTLLVSLHADTIYGAYFDPEKAAPGDAAIVGALLEEQHALQAQLLAALGADPAYAQETTPEALERNRWLIAAFDRLSLELCWGIRAPVEVPNVPTSGPGRATLRLTPVGKLGQSGPDTVSVEPWPFAASRVDLVCEGTLLAGRFADAALLHAALRDPALRRRLRIALVPP